MFNTTETRSEELPVFLFVFDTIMNMILFYRFLKPKLHKDFPDPYEKKIINWFHGFNWFVIQLTFKLILIWCIKEKCLINGNVETSLNNKKWDPTVLCNQWKQQFLYLDITSNVGIPDTGVYWWHWHYSNFTELKYVTSQWNYCW